MPTTIPDPAEAARICACFNLRKAARAVTQFYEAALEPTGIRATQLSVLIALAVAGRAPLSRVADGLVMDRTTLTRNLRPLARRGWIEVDRGPDRRERTLSLTRAGRAALGRALPLWQAAQATIVAPFGSYWAALAADLDRVVAAAQAATAAAGRR